MIYRWIPAIDSLRSYCPGTLAADTAAGLTVAAVAVPQAMAYAQVAGLPPQYGLYTAIVMTAVGALLDSSKQLINGPTNAISIAVLSALVGFSGDDRLQAAFLLALMVGVIQTGISLLRLGDLSRFISHAVIVGFTLGAAVLLAMDQLKNLLGVPSAGEAEDHFLKRFWLTLHNFDRVNYAAMAIGVGTIIMALVLRMIGRWMKVRLPELLLAVIAAGVAVWYWDLDQRGVQVVGDVPAALPAFSVPEMEWQRVRNLAGGSFAIALLGLLEAIAMAKAIAAHTRQKLDINQQCFSEGVANLAGSMFQCFPGSGSLTRSNINAQSGAKTQWSGVISAAAVASVVLVFAPYAYYIPKAGLAGVLVLSAYRLVDPKQLNYYLRTTRFDAIIVLATAISAVAISVEFCVLIGVFLSFVLYVPQAARIHMTELVLSPEKIVRERVAADAPGDQIRIYSLEGEMFFGAAPELEYHLEWIADTAARENIRVVVLRVKRARNPDAVCLDVLDRFITAMQAARVQILLCGIRPDLMKALKSSGLVDRVGENHLFVFPETGEVWTSTLQAIHFAYEQVGEALPGESPRANQDTNSTGAWYYSV